MSVYSDQLANLLIPGVATAAFTVPAGQTAYVRTQIFNTASGGSLTVQSYIRDAGSLYPLRRGLVVPPSPDLVLDEWFVVLAGQSLEYLCSVGGNVRVWVFGGRLEGEPP